MEDLDLQSVENNPPSSRSLLSNLSARKDPFGEILHIINTLEDDRPVIIVEIAGIQKRGLLDSGSAVTVMVLDSRSSEMNLVINPTALNLKVADGSYLDVLGYVDIPIKYKKQLIVMPTVVVRDCVQNLILGFDFWKKAGFQIVDPYGVEVAMVSAGMDINTEIELQARDKQSLVHIVNSFLITTEKFLGRTKLLTHTIELVEGAKPFFKRPHLYSPVLEKKMIAELDSMLNMGIIVPSKSPVASPIVPVSKSDGSVRLCLDSRTLNSLTVKDKFPIPNMAHIFARMPNARYLSIIDLSKAFWQVPLSEVKQKGQFASSQELTAFVFPGRGLFHFCVMPFGLTNSPATQCRLMYLILGHDLEPFVFVYMDDILLLATSVQHMLDLLREVARRLTAANLSINFQKSRFFAREVKYLGYILDSRGMRVDPNKLSVMEDYPAPKTVKEVRRFLGLTGYYRRLIANYSGIAAPLSDLLKKTSGQFKWNPEAEAAFIQLKRALCTSPVVTNPDFEEPFRLQCDASDYSASAVLGQIQDSHEVVIAYYSHKWTGSEKSWCATEKEGACVIYAVRHFRCYLYGREFTVITDAQALTHLLTMKLDMSAKLSRWATEINQYQARIKHRSGKLSVVPDALSRAVTAIMVIEYDYTDDAWYQRIRQGIETEPANHQDFRLQGHRLFKFETVEDDIGCYGYIWKEYVPLQAREDVVKAVHEQMCHLGSEKCIGVLKRKYFWPGLTRFVYQFLRSCDTCLRSKARMPLTRVPMGQSSMARYPFQVIAIDHFGPTVRSSRRNEWLFVVVDIFSKYVMLHPSRTGGAREVVTYLEHEVFLKMGVPEILISDNARAFIGRKMVDLLNRYGVRHKTNAIFHSQSNPAERYIRTVIDAVRSKICDANSSHRRWDVDIPRIQCAINSCRNEATGKTPYFINFGRELILNGEDYTFIEGSENRVNMSVERLQEKFQALRNEVYRNLQRSHQKYATYYDRKSSPLRFEINGRVWRRNHTLSSTSQHFSHKLAPKFRPSIVRQRLGNDTYLIEDEESGSLLKVHANDLFPDRV